MTECREPVGLNEPLIATNQIHREEDRILDRDEDQDPDLLQKGKKLQDLNGRDRCLQKRNRDLQNLCEKEQSQIPVLVPPLIRTNPGPLIRRKLKNHDQNPVQMGGLLYLEITGREQNLNVLVNPRHPNPGSIKDRKFLPGLSRRDRQVRNPDT